MQKIGFLLFAAPLFFGISFYFTSANKKAIRNMAIIGSAICFALVLIFLLTTRTGINLRPVVFDGFNHTVHLFKIRFDGVASIVIVLICLFSINNVLRNVSIERPYRRLFFGTNFIILFIAQFCITASNWYVYFIFSEFLFLPLMLLRSVAGTKLPSDYKHYMANVLGTFFILGGLLNISVHAGNSGFLVTDDVIRQYFIENEKPLNSFFTFLFVYLGCLLKIVSLPEIKTLGSKDSFFAVTTNGIFSLVYFYGVTRFLFFVLPSNYSENIPPSLFVLMLFFQLYLFFRFIFTKLYNKKTSFLLKSFFILSTLGFLQPNVYSVASAAMLFISLSVIINFYESSTLNPQTEGNDSRSIVASFFRKLSFLTRGLPFWFPVFVSISIFSHSEISTNSYFTISFILCLVMLSLLSIHLRESNMSIAAESTDVVKTSYNQVSAIMHMLLLLLFLLFFNNLQELVTRGFFGHQLSI